jgi:hypothetical protein
MVQLSLSKLGLSIHGSESTHKQWRGENPKSETSFGSISQNGDQMFQSLPSTDLLALVIGAWETAGRESTYIVKYYTCLSQSNSQTLARFEFEIR